MKKSVMKKWVQALRSGKYSQGSQRLESGEGYCCLGVLCAIAPPTVKVDAPSGRIQGYTLLGQPDVQAWAGLRSASGRIKFSKAELSLVSLNDYRRRNFKQIAAFIERNWEKL